MIRCRLYQFYRKTINSATFREIRIKIAVQNMFFLHKFNDINMIFVTDINVELLMKDL